MDAQAIEKYVKESGKIDMQEVQERFDLKYSETVKVLAEFEKQGLIKYCDGFTYELTVPLNNFHESVNSANLDTDKDDEQEDLTEMRRRLAERLKSIYGLENEDGNDEEDEEDDDEDDDEEWGKARREYLEKKRREIIERMRLPKEKDEQDKKAEYEKTVAELQSERKKMYDYNSEDETFSIRMNVAYPNGMPFRIKVIENNGCLYMSDCGSTIEYLSEFNQRESLVNYFESVLKSQNIRMIENAICTTIDDIHDLSGEASFLFKVVNGLVTQENFDTYYLGEEQIKLANDILAKDDSEMMIKALSLINDKPIRTIELQRSLHIGFVRAGRIIDSLTELGVLESSGTLVSKSETISNGFVPYLKRMLDERK